MDLNDLVTPILRRHHLAPDTSEVGTSWYTADEHDSWITTVYKDFITVRDIREAPEVITFHKLSASDPKFLEKLEQDLKSIIEWLR